MASTGTETKMYLLKRLHSSCRLHFNDAFGGCKSHFFKVISSSLFCCALPVFSHIALSCHFDMLMSSSLPFHNLPILFVLRSDLIGLEIRLASFSSR